MEAAPTQRAVSLQTYRRQNKWTSISDIDAGDEELENSKTGKSDEKTIYEVQQGRRPFDIDPCSTSIDGNLDNDSLQQRLHGVARQRGELQQMEIELQAQIIARSEIFDMQNKLEAQIEEHSNSVIELQEQLCGRNQTICELEQKIEDKDRELHAIKLDNEAAWAKEDLYRKQDEEVATYRRERDQSEAEMPHHIKQIQDLQEHILEKERQIIDLQEQQRVSQETIIYKDEQLREAHAWIARVQEMDVLQSTTNHSLQAELQERTEQFNQLWLGCQRQFAEMERLHLHSIQQLQLELAEAKERSGAYIHGSRTSMENLKDDSQYAKSNGSKLDTNGSSTPSGGNTGALLNGSSDDVLSFVSTGNALSQDRSSPLVSSSVECLTSGQVTSIHPYQQSGPYSIVNHFHPASAVSSIQRWHGQLIPENELQSFEKDEQKSTAKAGDDMSINGVSLHPDHLNGQNAKIGRLDSVPSLLTEGTQVDSIDRGSMVVSQPEQSLGHFSSQFHNALSLDSLEHKIESQEQNVLSSIGYAEGKTASEVQPSYTVNKSPSAVASPQCNNLIEFGIDKTAGSVPTGAFSPDSHGVLKTPETPLLDERSLLACIVRTIPPGSRIQISSTLPNRLVKMLAPLHWQDYQKNYGKLSDFVSSHPELFVIVGDYIQLRKGAQEIIAATAAVAKVAAAAAASSSPDSSYLPPVALTPMSQAYQLRKTPSVDSENCTLVQNQQLNGVCFGTRAGVSSVKLPSKSKDNWEMNTPEAKHGQLSGASISQSIGSTNGRPRNNLNGKHQGRMAGPALSSRR